jgi:hypothetical protein
VERAQNVFISHLTNLTVLSRLAADFLSETPEEVILPYILAHPVGRRK